MAGNEAKQALLGALNALLDGDGAMGDMDDVVPALEEFVRAHAHPDFVCTMVPIPPGPIGEYPGLGGVTQAWRDWGATFESVRAEAEEIRQAEHAVALFVNQIVITRHGGVEMSQPSAILWLFEGERLRRLEFHLDRSAALEAGGWLQPPAPGD